MLNYNSSFKVRCLTIYKGYLLTLFILVLVISPLMAINEAEAELITFDEYPLKTTITDQYQDLGVVFSGEPQPPIIKSLYPSWGIDDPVLMGADGNYNWGSDSIILCFVDPTDGIPVEAINVDFYFYWLNCYGSPPVTIDYYDINGNIISQTDLQEDSNPHIPSRLQKFVITTQTAQGSNYFWIDDLSFETLTPQPSIVDPGPSSDSASTAGEPINLTTGDVWVSFQDRLFRTRPCGRIVGKKNLEQAFSTPEELFPDTLKEVPFI